MAKYIGRRIKIGIGKESVRGTAIAPTYLIPDMSFSFDDMTKKARSDAGLGRIEDSEESFVVSKWGEGDFEGEVRASSFGLILLSLLGSVATSAPVDSAYTHTFTLSQTNQHPSLSLLVGDPNTTEAYPLGMINSLELTADLENVLKFSCGFMSKQGSTSVLAQATLATEFKFTKKHAIIKLATTLAGLDAAPALSIKELSLTINKNAALDEVLGSVDPEDILNHQTSVEGSLKLNYEDETFKNYAKDGTFRAMRIQFINTDATIGAGTTPKLTFEFPKVDFYDWKPNNALEDIVTQDIAFKGNYDLTNGVPVITNTKLVNTVASY